MSLRDSVLRIVTPWLARFVGERFLWGSTLAMDGMRAAFEEGVKARMPGIGTPDALPHIGRDRLLDRGPTETDASYIERLRGAFDTWRVAGNAFELLRQLQAYFSPTPRLMRLVSDQSVWHTSTALLVLTKLRIVPANWKWDAFTLSATPRWWRTWVIIDSTDGKWTSWTCGSGQLCGTTTYTCGSTATPFEVQSIRAIVARFKPGDKHCMNIIIMLPTFAPQFDPALAPGAAPNPNGTYDNVFARARPAAYWAGAI